MAPRHFFTLRRFFLLLSAVAVCLFATAPQGRAGSDDPASPRRQLERPGRTGLPLPRFVTLRAAKVNLRTGPGIRYPIDWVYQRRDLPVEVIDEFETWRRIRDRQGTVGWIHQSMLQGRRSVVVTDDQRLLLRAPRPDAPGVARLEPGVIARLEGCAEAWCSIEVNGFAGWLRRHEIYGVSSSD